MWIEELTRALAGAEREFWPQVVAEGYQGGRWPWEAFEVMGQLREVPPPPKAARRLRLPPRHRLERWDERPQLPTGQHLQMMAADAVLDWLVSDGALRCLALLVVLAGPRGRLQTLTCSLAKLLGRTRGTANAYLNALQEAGYITRLLDRRTGISLIVIAPEVLQLRRRDLAKPAPAWPRLPQPKVWKGWRRRGGARFSAHIKPGSEKVAREGWG